MMAGGLFKGIKYYLIGNVDEKVSVTINYMIDLIDCACPEVGTFKIK